jgi:hypothetical protein
MQQGSPAKRKPRPFRYRGEPLIDSTTPWEQDYKCQYIVACHPGGLTLEQISSLLCVTRERVRQIEASALRKLKNLPLDEMGIELPPERESYSWRSVFPSQDMLPNNVVQLFDDSKPRRRIKAASRAGARAVSRTSIRRTR